MSRGGGCPGGLRDRHRLKRTRAAADQAVGHERDQRRDGCGSQDCCGPAEARKEHALTQRRWRDRYHRCRGVRLPRTRRYRRAGRGCRGLAIPLTRQPARLRVRWVRGGVWPPLTMRLVPFRSEIARTVGRRQPRSQRSPRCEGSEGQGRPPKLLTRYWSTPHVERTACRAVSFSAPSRPGRASPQTPSRPRVRPRSSSPV